MEWAKRFAMVNNKGLSICIPKIPCICFADPIKFGMKAKDLPCDSPCSRDVGRFLKSMAKNLKNFTKTKNADDFSRKFSDKRTVEKVAEKAAFKAVLVKRQVQRKRFILAQKKCFVRLFRVTAGMMCLQCRADYTKFIKVTGTFMADKTWPNGTVTKVSKKKWGIKLAKKVCTNLQADCFEYLNGSQNLGKQILWMKQQKKLRESSNKIAAALSDFKARLADAQKNGNFTRATAALAAYKEKVKNATSIAAKDFIGHPDKKEKDAAKKAAANVTGDFKDFQYGMMLPPTCKNKTNCNWIWQKDFTTVWHNCKHVVNTR